jgi:hypothetical protein
MMGYCLRVRGIGIATIVRVFWLRVLWRFLRRSLARARYPPGYIDISPDIGWTIFYLFGAPWAKVVVYQELIARDRVIANDIDGDKAILIRYHASCVANHNKRVIIQNHH